MHAALLTVGTVDDTTMLSSALDETRVPRTGLPRTRPDRVLTDKGYQSWANRTWLAERGIRATIPAESGRAANRRKKEPSGSRSPSLNAEIYKGRNVVERCFNNLKRWHGIATRTDKTARTFRAAIQLAAMLSGLGASFSNAPRRLRARRCRGSCRAHG